MFIVRTYIIHVVIAVTGSYNFAIQIKNNFNNLC